MRTIPLLSKAFLLTAVFFSLVTVDLPAQDRTAGAPAAVATKASYVKAESGKTVNINQASLEQLTDLKGIGPVTAKRILEFREKNGPFKKVEDLLSVKGIGEKKLEKMRDQVAL